MKQYWFMILMTLAVHYGSVESSCTRNGSVRAARYGSQIDAFNEDICGKSVVRHWQWDQSAFKCDSKPEKVIPFWPRTDRAMPGEFFSEVILTIYTDSGKDNRRRALRGIIIHKNLLLAHDLDEARMFLKYGRPKLDIEIGSGFFRDVEFETVCQGKGDAVHLWAVKLKKDIKYVDRWVGPACLKLDQQFDSKTSCAISTISGGYPSGYQEHHDFLSDPARRIDCPPNDLPSRWLPFGHCYDSFLVIEQWVQYYPGATVYCYDNCGGKGQRAYAVGRFLLQPGNEYERTPKWAMDYSKRSDKIRKLIARIMDGERSSNIHCLDKDLHWDDE